MTRILLAVFFVVSFPNLSTVRAGIYITEENVQIDRCACAWFISRFLDDQPDFKFIKQGETPPPGISYDFFGADYFHKGPDCSYTSFVKKHIKKKNKALIEINKVVNDVFAWRNGPNSLSVSIKEHIDLLAKSGKSDSEIYENLYPLFDLLYLVHQGDTQEISKSGLESLAQMELNLAKQVYGYDTAVRKQLEATHEPASLNNKSLNKTFLIKLTAVKTDNKNATSLQKTIRQILE